MKSARSVVVPATPDSPAVETFGAHSATATSTVTSPSGSSAADVQHLDLPANPAPLKSLGTGAAKAVPGRLARRANRVLVADDSAAVREALAQFLTAAGYEVVLAADGEEALAKFVPGGVDLVLLDLEMPVKNGWAAFEEMVARDANQAIILMSDRLEQVDLTTTGHLARLAEKPLNFRTLLGLVESVLRETQASRRSVLAAQQNLARYAKPYVGGSQAVESYEHWGLND
jgi:CheY-like chemotaxis protein